MKGMPSAGRGIAVRMWLVCALGTTTIPGIHAQAAPQQSDTIDITRRSHPIEAVSVSGRRAATESAVALTRTVLDSAQLAQSSNLSFAELLARHTPVFVRTYGLGSLATISFRGMAASHTQAEWNGIRINNPMVGQVDFSLLPVWFVDYVSLYHGGSSLGTGSGALGGTVATGSAPRWDRKAYGTALQSIGSFSTRQSFVMAGAGNGTLQGRIRYICESAKNDFTYLKYGYVGPPEKVRQTHADYTKQGALADLWWNVGRGHLLSFNLWWLEADRKLPVHTFYFGPGRRETQFDRELRAVAQWKKHGERYRSEWTSGFAATKLNYRKADLTGLDKIWLVNADSRSGFSSFYNKYRFEYRLSKRTSLEALANGDGHRARIDYYKTQNKDGSNHRLRDEFGLGTTLRHHFSEAFSGFTILRRELIAGKFSPWMPAAGVEYRPLRNDVLRVLLNGARNYHHPTLNDLYWVPGGNPDLLPEESLTGDLSLLFSKRSGSWSCNATVTGYAASGKNWIVWVGNDAHYFLRATNVAKVSNRGAEAAFHAGYERPHWQIALHGNYAYTRATPQGSGRQLPNIPEHKANTMLDGNWRSWYGLWLYSFVGERNKSAATGSRLNVLDAYQLHDLTLGKRFIRRAVQFEIQGMVKNLFDISYEPIAARAVPGRNCQILVKLTF